MFSSQKNEINEIKILNDNNYLDQENLRIYFILLGNNYKLPSDLNISSEQILTYETFNFEDRKTFESYIKEYYISFSKLFFPLDRKYSNEFSITFENIYQLFLGHKEEFRMFIMIITEICIKHLPYGNMYNNYPEL